MKTAIARSLIVLSTVLASHAAQAEAFPRVSLSVGEWIAAQGNAALQEVVDDVRQQLKETLEPMPPERSPEPASVPASAQGKARTGG